MAARTKGQINELKKRFGVRDATNPILDLCVDANQSTPFEALLLGLYKYLFRDMTRYYNSFVGRDLLNLQFTYHRVWMMVKKKVWFKLSKVSAANLKRKLKVHLLLHLCESMLQFGPTLSYNTERCESFNSIIRAKNIFSNKHSPSKYIATNFGVEESIQNICSGISDKFGAELVELYKSDVVSEYLGKHVESEKCIYQQGTLRKLSTAALELGAIKMTIPERGAILLSQPIASCRLLMPPSMKSCNQFCCHLWICRKLVYSGEVSELVKVPTVLSSFLNQKQLFHKAVYLMKYDCPLLTMVDFCVIPSSSVCAAVSVVHKCTTTCSFVEKTASAVVEGLIDTLASEVKCLRVIKKSSKQRAEYLQKQDDILSQENKAKSPSALQGRLLYAIATRPIPKRRRPLYATATRPIPKRRRPLYAIEENRAAKRQKYEDNSAAIKASERNRYWNDPAVRLAKRAAGIAGVTELYHYHPKASLSDVQRQPATVYSLYEPKSHALMEYNGGLEKAILRDSELLSEVNDAFLLPPYRPPPAVAAALPPPPAAAELPPPPAAAELPPPPAAAELPPPPPAESFPHRQQQQQQQQQSYPRGSGIAGVTDLTLPLKAAALPPPPPAVAAELPPMPPAVAAELPPPPPAVAAELPPAVAAELPPAVAAELPPPPPAVAAELPPPLPAVAAELPPPPPAVAAALPPPPPAVAAELPPPPPAVAAELPPPPPAVAAALPPPPPAVAAELPPPPPAVAAELPPPPPAVAAELPPPPTSSSSSRAAATSRSRSTAATTTSPTTGTSSIDTSAPTTTSPAATATHMAPMARTRPPRP
eukprot:Em0028g60a